MSTRTHHHHLDDEALIERRLADPSAPLADADHCELCVARAAEVGRWLEDLQQVSLTEADTAFPPHRMAQQKGRVLRRLRDLVGAGVRARVLTFPVSVAATAGSSRWSPRRVVATAAAAGLITGVMASTLFDLTSRMPTNVAPTLSLIQPLRTDGAGTAAPAYGEEDFLTEIDNALEGSKVQELQALDAFTPSVLEASFVLP